MKLIKLMTVTALTVGAVFGAVVESAEAGFTQNGSSGSGWRTDGTEVDYSLTLFPTVEDSNPQPRRGFFKNAITNFTGGFDDFTGDGFEFDLVEVFKSIKAVRPDEIGRATDSDGSLKTYEFIPEAITLNLRTRLLERDRKIEYILSGQKLRNKGITELALIIDERNLGVDEDFNFFKFSDISSLNTFEKRKQAVNSLDYIIDNALLGLINNIRVSGFSSDGSGKIVQSSDVVSQVYVELITQKIPEYDSKNCLLVLGILGTALGLKRRFQIKS
ncbi:MAG: hypothetical protein VKK42_31130 [Lyngbya sp.]|nr:hypothetical protein [Lyngbya sp.]